METAVNASISTPVWPSTLALTRTLIPGKACGWQSGIRSCVFLAAMIAAIRAAAKTSPFLALPDKARSRVACRMTILPSAIATRSVVPLPETSTIWACPAAERWVRSGIFDPKGGGASRQKSSALGFVTARVRFADQKRPRRRRDVFLAHENFADENSRNAVRLQAQTIMMREDASLADDDPVRRNFRSEPFAHVERHFEGS